MPNDRYFVTPPADSGGDDYWKVRDRNADEQWAVAWFWGKLPRAEREARGLCDRLNRDEADHQQT